MGELYSVDGTLLRLAAVFVFVATGFVPLLITYLAGWIIIPVEPLPQAPDENLPADPTP